MKYWATIGVFLSIHFSLFAQCPEANFLIESESACLNQGVNISNLSSLSNLYEWDFCVGELGAVPSNGASYSNSSFSVPVGVSFINESNVNYAVISSRNNSSLFILNYPTIDSDPVVINIITNPLFNGPEWVELVRLGSDWIGFALNFNNSHLLRLHFEGGITSVPTVEDLGDLGGVLSVPRGLELVSSVFGDYLLISNTGKDHIIRIEVGDNWLGPLNEIAMDTIGAGSGINDPFGISLIDSCGYWYGLVSSSSNNRYYHLNFGTDISSVPQITEIGVATSPREIKWAEEGGKYYGFGGSSNGSIYRIDFDTAPGGIGAITDLGNLGGILDNAFGFDIVRDSSRWRGFSMNFSNKQLTKIDFEDDCTASVSSSTAFEPSGIFYSSSGSKQIGLTVTDENGNSASTRRTVTVSDDQAPDISITVDANICIVNSNTFTSENLSGDITSYSWDFGDGSAVESGSDLSEVTHQYAIAGDYTVSLEVSNGTCSSSAVYSMSVYEEPSLPSFSIGGVLCSNAALTFTNTTDVSSYPLELVTFAWSFDNTIVSSQSDTIVSFETFGSKSISLTVGIPGCEVTKDSIIVLDQGPEVGFSWTDNCFSEELSFINNTSGSNLTYSWDFGDGSPLSTDMEPTHTYALADTFDVVLTVTNENLCESVLIKSLIVNDDPLVQFNSSSSSVENLPVTFEGIDLTSTQDSIRTWLWDFAGQGTSSDINPVFTFSTPDIYAISLVIETYQGCQATYNENIVVTESQCPTPAFSTTANLCRDEQFSLSNESINATSYAWDFCIGELDNSSQSLTSIYANIGGTPIGYKMVEESGSWYGFVASRGSSEVEVLSYSAIDSIPILVQTLSDPLFAGPEWVELVQEGEGWVGYVLNFNNSHIIRVHFNNGLSSAPIYEDLGDFGELLDLPRGLELAKSGTDNYLFVSDINTNRFYRVEVGGGSWLGDLDEVGLSTLGLGSGLNRPMGISLLDSCGHWYGLVSSNGNNRYYHLDFGTDLSSTPTIQDLGVSPSKPVDIKWVTEGGNYYAFGTGASGNLYRLRFGDNPSILEGMDDLTNFSGGLANAFGFDIVKDSSRWRGFSMNFSSKLLTRIDFEDDCTASVSSSTAFEPSGIFYSSSGSKQIGLTVTDENGNSASTRRTVTVSDDQAPDISITVDANRCIVNTNTFTASNLSGDLTSYSWDFDDGTTIETGSDLNTINHQYSILSTYDIRLDVVSDEGCNNSVTKQITIYPEPPVPTFEISASAFCEGNEITLDNLIDDEDYDGLVSYYWSATGLSSSVTTEGLSITFEEAGEKTISVYSSIPGCESAATEQTIEIFNATVTDFSASSACEGELTSFNNLSETATYQWSFGDGISSTETSPDHLYDVYGTYNVALAATNDNGCVSTVIEQVAVSPLPVPDFSFDLVCRGDPATFEDLSFVTQSAIIAWEWAVDGEPISQDQNPIINFETSGLHEVALQVFTEDGCSQVYTEDIDVLATPQLIIETSGVCLNESISIIDATQDQQNLQLRSWFVDGVLQSDLTGSFDYQFIEAGIHEIQLNADQTTGCSVSTVMQIEISENPTLGFDIAGQCENEEIIVNDITQSGATNEVVSRTWKLDGASFGNGLSGILPDMESGSYELSFEATTALGCVLEHSEMVEIVHAPDIQFDLSNDYGVPPFTLLIENNTKNASSYIWYLNDEQVSTQEEPNLTIVSEGIKQLKLVGQNVSGCIDSTEVEINSALPIIDLEINQMQLVENGNTNNILLEVTNNSNIPIELLDFSISLENAFELSEQVLQRINVGQQEVITLSTGIPGDLSNLGYLCVNLSSAFAVLDQTPINNESCENLAIQRAVFEPPFPNPAKENIEIRAIIPSDGRVIISLADLSGQVQIKKVIDEISSGLNVFDVDLFGLQAGTYLLYIQYDGGNYKYRVIKH